MTSSLKPAIIFSTDENYAHLARMLVHSIRENVTPFKDISVECLDIGMSETSRRTFEAAGVTIHRADINRIAPSLRRIVEAKPYMLAQFYRPYLPELIDGDVCIHIDCDAWLQNAELIDACVSGVEMFPDRMLLTPSDGHYSLTFYEDLELTLRIHHNSNYGCYEKTLADRLSRMAFFSSGVFAARTDSTVWGRWEAEINRILPLVDSLNPQALHLAEQTALNGVVRVHAQVTALDPIFNFHCNSGGAYRDPHTGKVMTALLWPQREISVVHLATWDRMQAMYETRDLLFKPRAPFPNWSFPAAA